MTPKNSAKFDKKIFNIEHPKIKFYTFLLIPTKKVDYDIV
jgi:hypothetical protein